MKVGILAVLSVSVFGLRPGTKGMGDTCKHRGILRQRRCVPGLECAAVEGRKRFGVCKGNLGASGCSKNDHCVKGLVCENKKCAKAKPVASQPKKPEQPKQPNYDGYSEDGDGQTWIGKPDRIVHPTDNEFERQPNRVVDIITAETPC